MLSDLRYRLRAMFRGRVLDRELDEELRFHLEQQAAADERAGVPRDEARRRAQLAFGGVDRAKEASRDGRGVSLVDVAWRDVRYAVRTLRRSPVFTLVAIVSLTLGIGANTAMFQLLNALVLRPLPIAHPEQLVEIRMREQDLAIAGGSFPRYPALTWPIREEIETRQEAFSAIVAWADESFNLAPSGESRPAPGLWVSGNFFETLGLAPAAGRLLTAADDRRGCGLPGAIVSYDFWQRELGGDVRAIGRTLTVNGLNVDVIGVAPRGFFGLEVGRSFDVALPLCAMDAVRPGSNVFTSGIAWWVTVMGRLKPGWTVARADAHLGAISAGLFKATRPAEYPAPRVPSYLASRLVAVSAGAGLSPLRESYQDALVLLLAMTGLMLLIACANLTNLLLARGAVRQRELSLRLALGASRGRLVSQLLCESLLIAGVSAGAGLLVAHTLSRALVALLGTSGSPIVLAVAIDWRVLAFTGGVATITCVLLGLTPALRATRGSPGDVLKTGTRGAGDRESLGLRRALVVTQVAVSLVLVVGALLFARSFRNLLAEPLGFEREGVLIVNAHLPPPPAGFEAAAAFKRDVLARLRATPGVAAAAQTNVVPLSGSQSTNTVWLDGAGREQGQLALFARVSPGYFDTMGMALLGGRDIADRDTETSPRIAVVNETFARTFLRGGNPVGRRFWVDATPTRPQALFEIVGLVRDAKYRRLREEMRPVAFLAIVQHGTIEAGGQWLVRTPLTAEALAPALRQSLLAVNGNVRFSFRVLDSEIRDSMRRERVLATLSSLFGGLAGLLAAVGLHGVVAYMVQRRRREIGIRVALGASRGAIVGGVLRESGALVVAGLGVGVVLSLLLTRTARTLLFHLRPDDAATLVVAMSGLGAVALLAAWLPARRAARVDPMTTLKDE